MVAMSVGVINSQKMRQSQAHQEKAQHMGLAASNSFSRNFRTAGIILCVNYVILCVRLLCMSIICVTLYILIYIYNMHRLGSKGFDADT